MPEETLLQLGAVFILFAIAIREFFGYLKLRKNGGSEKQYGFSEAIFKELQTMNTNHLHSIEKAVREGNDRLIESMHNDNTRIVEALGEIKGRLK
jgi:hypothetical protein